MQELGLGNGGNRPDRLKDRSRHFSVHANKGDGVGPALGFAAAESESSDIDSKLPKSASNLADDTRFIAVPQIENGAFQLRLQRNSFDLENARRTIMQDCAFSRKTCRRSGFFRHCGDFQSVWEAMF